MQNHRFLKALKRESVDRPPVWLMRQAGRYLPEYRALRAKVPDFMTFCKTPDLACEVTLQPIRRFGFDAAILFSDILTIPDALDVGLKFQSGEGPVIHKPIRSLADVAALPNFSVPEKLGYVFDAIKLIKHELANQTPLIGFAGSPWTVACYMVEGAGSKLFLTIRKMLYANPEILHELLNKLTQITIEYLNGQIAAGVNAVMLFDTWGGLLTPETYQEFSLNYMQRILQGLKLERDSNAIPVIFFTKGAGNWLEIIADSGCDALGVDWTINIAEARKRVGSKVAVQGNLDPAVLLSTPKKVKQAVRAIITAWGDAPGYIFNLGHGIDKSTPIENVEALIEAVVGTGR